METDRATIDLDELRENQRRLLEGGVIEDWCAEPHEALALIAVAEAARSLLDDLDDAIAGADLEAWDAPYRIETPLFSKSADALRDALRPMTPLPDDGF